MAPAGNEGNPDPPPPADDGGEDPSEIRDPKMKVLHDEVARYRSLTGALVKITRSSSWSRQTPLTPNSPPVQMARVGSWPRRRCAAPLRGRRLRHRGHADRRPRSNRRRTGRFQLSPIPLGRGSPRISTDRLVALVPRRAHARRVQAATDPSTSICGRSRQSRNRGPGPVIRDPAATCLRASSSPHGAVMATTDPLNGKTPSGPVIVASP